MSGVVNLRTRRKQAKRTADRAEAAARAAVHGEAQTVRDLREAQADLETRRLDGHRLAPQATLRDHGRRESDD